MDDYPDSTDRSAAEYVLFALGFLGFLVALSGVIIASTTAAILGTIILLLVVLGFYSRSALRA